MASAATSTSVPEPQSPTYTSHLTRHNTASSVESDQYTTLPPGRWRLHLHGSCPRCHHLHSALKVKLAVSNDTSKVSHVHCERCSAKWLAFGGSNSTRISLLSTLSSTPDPAETQVYNAVVSMIKTATTMSAVGSPSLSRIPETTDHTSLRPNSTILPAGNNQSHHLKPQESSRPLSFHSPVVGAINGEPPASTENSVAASHQVNGPSLNLLSQAKRRLKSRMPVISVARIRDFFGHSTPKFAVDAELVAAPRFPVSVAAETTSQTSAPTSKNRQALQHETITSPEDPVATDYIKILEKDRIDLMDEPRRIQWGREKLTGFKDFRTQHMAPSQSRADDDSVQTSHRQQAYDLLHAGIREGGVSRFRFSGSSSHGPTLSVSTDRTSEVPTLVEDTSSTARFSWLENFRRQRRESLLPGRSSSMPLQSHHQHLDIQHFLDATTGSGVVRNSSTTRGRPLTRWSRATAARGSHLHLPEQPPVERSDDDLDAASLIPNYSSDTSPGRRNCP